ncbi:MAG: gliding motility lipoprotein GldB [Polaribacter sp.]|jgi:gliding motility-associated lipoprotein GldB
MRFFLVFLIVLFSFFGCNTRQVNKADISNIDVSFKVKRFDVDFYNAGPENLQALKIAYPYFFPRTVTDSIALSKMNNKEERELFKETQKVYKDFSPIKDQLTVLLKHLKFYNPTFISPDIVTMLTNIDYNSRVIYADSLLIISLDVYLGANHKFYADFPTYIKENNTKEHLIVDVAEAFIAKQLPRAQERSFIAKMVYEGKKMYALDCYLPSVKEKVKSGYEMEKLNWVVANEEQVWRYFVDKELLFSTDQNLNNRFLESAPFSKFYREQDNLSPGSVGVWVGWQIVRSYMKHNDVSLQELLKINELDLYKKSKYKPRK